ncbi:hypothetical protein [Brevundimonas sp.]|uniref:hypothetical protein n=1 Tax=Brevundimonas sp. TaxID=1871086 RepID=UPI00289D83A8|nr:hypothetical protein [Brevundimonas sp.]
MSAVWASPCGRFWLDVYRSGDEARFAPRADMAEAWTAEGRRLPEGPKWTLCDKRQLRVLGIGGLEAEGAAASLGWFLSADLSARQWLAALDAVRDRLAWAQRHAVRRVHVLTAGDRPGAARMMGRVGFRLTGQEGGDAVMTRELH